ncbi:MAG: DUF115 domain-containing protein [Spirochaetaceae bacterium]|jgi:hypothetical protein|nr:DUF115 domain-containing protein [Spirochaetaceae bacterium]
MQERLVPTGSGAPTVYAGEQALHSRYNPRLEAEKYINTLKFRENIRFLILIEPGMGYMVPVLRKNNPLAKIITLHISDFFVTPEAGGDRTLEADAVWAPGKGIPVQRFLEQEIPDIEARFIGLIEWRPSLTAYGEAYLRLLSGTTDFIKRVDANARTVKGFGQRWFKNVFKNLKLFQQVLEPVPSSIPIAVTGAGPSLEETIPLIREWKQREALGILAAASSVEALDAGGILPDLIISTDGGGWAAAHLRGALRKNPPALTVTLNASLPSQCGELPILVLSDGSVWQNLILKSMAIPFVPLAPRGTVTASALELALALTQGEIFITGTDLSHRDLRTHARPYSFNRFLELGSSRFHPFYSETFVRAGAIADSGNHGIYAAWFGQQLETYPKRLHTLGNNNPVFNSLLDTEKPGLSGFGKNIPAAKERIPSGGGIINNFALMNRGSNRSARIIKPSFSAEHALEALLQALSDPGFAPIITGELSPLLLAEEKEPSPQALKKVVRSLAGPYFSEGLRNG